LIGYSDSDFAHSLYDRKSTFVCFFHLSLGVISWESKKHPIMTISSRKFEYVAPTKKSYQAVWLQRVMNELQQGHEIPTPVYCDNNLAIALSKNHVFHQKRNHIDTKYHVTTELLKNGDIYLEFYE